jgi:hypothetical protein
VTGSGGTRSPALEREQRQLDRGGHLASAAAHWIELDHDGVFELGLARLLDGIEARTR